MKHDPPKCNRCKERQARNGGLCWECLDVVLRKCGCCPKDRCTCRDGVTPSEDEGTCTPMYDAAFRWLEDGDDAE